MNKGIWDRWLAHARKVVSLDASLMLLEYDQRVTMPAANAGIRAHDVGVLEEVCHNTLINPWFVNATRELLESGGIADPEALACLKVTKRQIDRAVAVPKRLVSAIATAGTLSYQAWTEAKPRSDVKSFLPHLQKMVRLKREEAAALSQIGQTDCPYDALLDHFAPGMTLNKLLPFLETIVTELKPVVDRVRDLPISTDVLHLAFPEGDTVKFGMEVIEDLGYDYSRGMLVRTPHPVTMGLSVNDVRISVFSKFQGLVLTLLAMIHEAGHGMYRQGCPKKWWHTVLGGPMPISINESQSRFYEVILGRSLPFWEGYFPQMRKRFAVLKGTRYTARDIYRAINKIEPGCIRVAADPLTYAFHILVAVRVESALVNGEMEAEDVPGAWGNTIEHYLGVRPQNAAEGFMQDVHMAKAMFGYKGSYTLGDGLAAQLEDTIRRDIPDFDDIVRSQLFDVVLGWLREKIHRKGFSCTNEELIQSVTGRPLGPESLVRLCKRRAEDVYGITL